MGCKKWGNLLKEPSDETSYRGLKNIGRVIRDVTLGQFTGFYSQRVERGYLSGTTGFHRKRTVFRVRTTQKILYTIVDITKLRVRGSPSKAQSSTYFSGRRGGIGYLRNVAGRQNFLRQQGTRGDPYRPHPSSRAT